MSTCVQMSSRSLNYVLSHVFAAIWQIFRGGFQRFQSNQPKYIKAISFFLALVGDWTRDFLFLNQLPCHLGHYTSVWDVSFWVNSSTTSGTIWYLNYLTSSTNYLFVLSTRRNIFVNLQTVKLRFSKAWKKEGKKLPGS